MKLKDFTFSRRSMFASAGIAAVTAPALAVPEVDTSFDPCQNLRYLAQNASVIRSGARPHCVFIGDSLTEFWGIQRPELFGASLVNRGIQRQVSSQMVGRFWSDVLALKPRVVHILGGNNDMRGNHQAASPILRNSIMTMCELASLHGIKILLASVFQTAKPGFAAPTLIDAHNRWLKTYAHDHGAMYVDYSEVVSKTGSVRPDLTVDGLHLNKKGYDVITPLMQAALGKITTVT